MHSYVKKVVAGLAAAALTLLPAAPAFADGGHSQTTTPIKHLVFNFDREQEGEGDHSRVLILDPASGEPLSH